ncbi:MAG: hypothetical protein AABX38_05575 [Candidatus Micrarchaeota archaeon]
MQSKKGFVFSLDSFVAFTLCLVIIYSLIFFSSIPSGYYDTLTQAHFLTKDTLNALISTKCSFTECTDKSVNVLEHIVFRSAQKDVAIQNFIGSKIPTQFGYRFEILGEAVVYDSRVNPSDNHKKNSDKLSVSASTIVFGYGTRINNIQNPNVYKTCNGGRENLCTDISSNLPNLPQFEIKTVKLTVYI